MKKIFISCALASLLCFSCLTSISSNAIQSSTTDVPFDNFTINLSGSTLNTFSNANYEYYIILLSAKSSFATEDREYSVYLWGLSDNVSDLHKYIFYKSDDKDRFPSQGSFSFGSDTVRYTGQALGFSKKSSLLTGSITPFSSINSVSTSGGRNCSSDMLSLDFYNSGSFPYYYIDLPPTYYPTSTIMASNCDIYSSDGTLLQYASYDRLIDLCPALENLCSDLGENIAPTERPTFTGYEAEQTNNSRSIIQKITDLWYGITALPSQIAYAISDFFTNLKNGILDGLEYLFIPSDNALTDLIAYIKNNFGFITQLANITNVLLTAQYNGTTPPSFNITLPQSWGGQTYTTFNENFWFVLSSQWRTFIYSWVLAIMTYITVKKLHRSINDLINGESRKGGDFFD